MKSAARQYPRGREDTFVSRLRFIRGDQTQKNFATLLGIAEPTYKNYERGTRTPDALVLERVTTLGWSVDWLLTGRSPQLIGQRERLGVRDSGAESEAGPHSHGVSEAHLTIALELADRAIGAGYLPRPLYARLVRLLYDGVSQGLPVAQIEHIAGAAARSMAQGGKSDDGEPGVGAAGGAGAGRGGNKAAGQGNW